MAYTTINKSTDYFNTKLYTGTGANQSITGVGHQPDLVWIKDRDVGNNHVWTDAVRGVEKVILSNATNAETTYTDGLVAFTSDGFNLGDDDDGQMNVNGNNCVSWNWKAGGGAGSSNTDGSITSSVSANTTAGFSIVKYTATGNVGTIGHGLNAVPKLLIFKDLDDTGGNDWYVHHTSTGVNGRLILNGTNAVADNTNFLNQVLPTSTLITLGTASQVNNVGNDFICYAFAEKTGYSKFGSYTGNGSTDGTFVYTGFKPAFILMKKSSDSGNNWRIFDNKRSTSGSNVIDKTLRPNATTVEGSSNVDFVSNGVKIRNTDAEANTSGATYIYAAFGQSLVGTNNIPCTAR